jgi:aspartyl-tRNA(Asn)/glutamyl-tRNA(Gln) amidotransferase subunit C
MKLSVEQVRHVAALSRLSLTADEEELFRTQLQAVLDAAAQLDTLDLTDVPPTAQVNLTESPLRADVPSKPLSLEQVLADAPDKVDSSFAVPKVIE